VRFSHNPNFELARPTPYFPLPLFVTSIEIGNAKESAYLVLVRELLAAHEQHVLCEKKENESGPLKKGVLLSTNRPIGFCLSTAVRGQEVLS
jgi:hypothetical protein